MRSVLGEPYARYGGGNQEDHGISSWNDHQTVNGGSEWGDRMVTEWMMYSDSDHAGDRVVNGSRSVSGVMFVCNGMPIHWRSNKQPVSSTSSAVAEIYALSEAHRKQ